MKVPDLYVGKQLFVGLGKAISLGQGDALQFVGLLTWKVQQ